MDRSNHFAKIVVKSKKLLKTRNDKWLTKRDLITALQQSLSLLYTHQDYPEHLKPGLDNDFAVLPNEIIYDVIESEPHDYDNKELLRNLSLIDGSWAEYGREFMGSRSIRYTDVYFNSDFGKLEAKAPQLYEHFSAGSMKNYKTLELMGTRFSSVDICSPKKPCDKSYVVNFLKRQLKSKYLRKLRTGVAHEELDGLLVDFVKRAQFEELENFKTVPFEVVKEAHKAWAATIDFKVQSKLIKGKLSETTFQRIENYFNSKVPLESTEVCWDHPTHRSAKTRMKVEATNGPPERGAALGELAMSRPACNDSNRHSLWFLMWV